MEIRRAGYEELGQIMEIYAAARRYMAANGNETQWGSTHPPQSLIEEDIRREQCYIGIGEDGRVHAVFAFIPGEDPTYRVIENGAWLNDEPYSVIHRIASDGSVGGVFKECLDFCLGRCENIRIDTHENNLTMQHVLEKNNFRRCGIIYLESGSPRIAYQLETE